MRINKYLLYGLFVIGLSSIMGLINAESTKLGNFSYIPSFIRPNGLVNGHMENVLRLLFNKKNKELKDIFDEMEDINSCDEYIIPPLHLACYAGNLEIAKWLVDAKGADFRFNDVERGIRPPICYACTYLIYDSWRNSGIFCRNSGSFDIVKWLVEDKRVDVNPEHENDFSPFITACLYNRYDITKYFLEQGADINARYRSQYRRDYPLIGFQLTQNPFSPLEVMIDRFPDIPVTGDRSFLYCVAGPLRWKNFLSNFGWNQKFIKLFIEHGADVCNIANIDRINDNYPDSYIQSFINRKIIRSRALETAVNKLRRLIEGEEEETEGEDEEENNFGDYILSEQVKEKLSQIDNLMLDEETAIYTKQTVLVYLTRLYKQDENNCLLNLEKLKIYYSQIIFNNRIFNDSQFKEVIKLASQELFRDKFDRSILIAAVIYNRSGNMLPFIFSTNQKLYANNGLIPNLKKWLNSDCVCINQEIAEDDFVDALFLAKDMRRKKVLSILLNKPIILHYLRSEKLKNQLKYKELKKKQDSKDCQYEEELRELEDKKGGCLSCESCVNIISFM